jgi:hypothetical protein
VTEQSRISVATLKQAAEVLLEHVGRLEGEVVAVDKDYHWSIAPEQLYDIVHGPSDLAVGQLTECLDNFDAIVRQREHCDVVRSGLAGTLSEQ